MRTILCDSSYLFALYDPTDQWADQAVHVTRDLGLEDALWILPWPIVYEVLCTRMVRRRPTLRMLLTDWQQRERRNLLLRWDDGPYRSECLQDISVSEWGGRAISLADRVVRSILEDESCRVDAFITMNPVDFRDICTQRGLPCLP